jgi:hypothetical protein
MSYDLDYVTYDDEDKLAQVLASLGFKRKNKHYSHPECPFVIEFVAPPVAIGHEPIKQFQELRTKFGRVKLLRDVDCVKDRLASFYHWGDKQSLMQAVEVSLNRKVNFREIERWSTKEGFNKKFALFLAAYQKEKNKS